MEFPFTLPKSTSPLLRMLPSWQLGCFRNLFCPFQRLYVPLQFTKYTLCDRKLPIIHCSPRKKGLENAIFWKWTKDEMKGNFSSITIESQTSAHFTGFHQLLSNAVASSLWQVCCSFVVLCVPDVVVYLRDVGPSRAPVARLPRVSPLLRALFRVVGYHHRRPGSGNPCCPVLPGVLHLLDQYPSGVGNLSLEMYPAVERGGQGEL